MNAASSPRDTRGRAGEITDQQRCEWSVIARLRLFRKLHDLNFRAVSQNGIIFRPGALFGDNGTGDRVKGDNPPPSHGPTDLSAIRTGSRPKLREMHRDCSWRITGALS
ncbi:unnamed protein product [Leptosia nina]|uniref:Uncharacterized protein n=1 Tax=Leptosia nina TaxID=320188 RepID=A0AAV1K0C8_9NEOP